MKQQQAFHALGSDVILTIVHSGTPVYGDSVFAILRQHIAAFEQRFSRFLPDSELTRFNRRAGETLPVSPAFRAVLAAAKDAGQATGGLYNPFVLPALQRAGYAGSWPAPHVRQETTDFSHRAAAAQAEDIILGDAWARIPGGTALDFGGIGKGYLLDELAAILEAKETGGYWLSLGGDIVCAGRDEGGRPWAVGVQDARRPGEIVRMITNPGGTRLAIATSGVTKRRGHVGGRAWHHLIDPRTGEPASTDILTATVTAARALTADVYAKCIVIAGRPWAERAERAGNIRSFLIQKADAA